MLSLVGDKRADIAMCRLAAQVTLKREYGFSDREFQDSRRGDDHISEFRPPCEAVREWAEYVEDGKQLDAMDRVLSMLPQYLSVARRGKDGEAWVKVEYVRKKLKGGRRYGRAYPSVMDLSTGRVMHGVPSLTTMPRQVRNALISHPRQVLLDFDLAKCDPSIMLAASKMYGIAQEDVRMLGDFLSDPEGVFKVIGEQGGCSAAAAKQLVNKVVSDPCKRHSKQQGSWLQAFEHEVHKLRDMLIEHHAEGQEYKQQTWSSAPPP